MVCDLVPRSVLTHFFATPLGQKKIKIQSSSNMLDNDKTKSGEDFTDRFNHKNINHLTSLEELPDELCQKIQAKLDADLKAFLESCTKDTRSLNSVNLTLEILLLLHPLHPR